MHCLVKKYLTSWIFYLARELSQYLLTLSNCYSECKVLLWDFYTIRNTLVWLFLNITVLKVNDYCCVVMDHCYFEVSMDPYLWTVYSNALTHYLPTVVHYTVFLHSHTSSCFCVFRCLLTLFRELQSNNSFFTTHQMFCVLISCLLKIVVLSQIHHSLCHSSFYCWTCN